MSFDVGALFDETKLSICLTPSLTASSTSSQCPEPVQSTNSLAHSFPSKDKDDDGGLEGLSLMMGSLDSVGGSDNAWQLAHSPFDDLIRDRDEWKSKAKQHEEAVEALKKRLDTKVREEGPASSVARIRYLEHEKRRLETENKMLKSRFGEVERENTILENDNEGKSRKLKGANKKVARAKGVADQEEKKAKSAIFDKNHRLESERKMRKERNDALAALEEEKKITNNLRAELRIEQSGLPHLREGDSASDIATVSVPIEFRMYRADYQKLQLTFESKRVELKTAFVEYYKQWKKLERIKVVGAHYMPDQDDRTTKVDFGIAGDVGSFDEFEGILETGAEHNGWRSKRGLESLCDQTQSAYNARNQ